MLCSFCTHTLHRNFGRAGPGKKCANCVKAHRSCDGGRPCWNCNLRNKKCGETVDERGARINKKARKKRGRNVTQTRTDTVSSQSFDIPPPSLSPPEVQFPKPRLPLSAYINAPTSFFHIVRSGLVQTEPPLKT